MKALFYGLRFIWFAAKYVLIVLLITAILVIGYIMIRDTANVYVIVSEGMEMRASTIFKISNQSELFKYFSGTYLSKDTDITSNTYEGFLIRDFDYDLKIKSLWCDPWEKTATVELIESIPHVNGEYPTTTEGEVPKPLPQRARHRYRIDLISIEGRWLINGVTLLENMSPAPTKTQEPVLTPTPEGMTPTPVPSAS